MFKLQSKRLSEFGFNNLKVWSQTVKVRTGNLDWGNRYSLFNRVKTNFEAVLKCKPE